MRCHSPRYFARAVMRCATNCQKVISSCAVFLIFLIDCLSTALLPTPLPPTNSTLERVLSTRSTKSVTLSSSSQAASGNLAIFLRIALVKGYSSAIAAKVSTLRLKSQLAPKLSSLLGFTFRLMLSSLGDLQINSRNISSGLRWLSTLVAKFCTKDGNSLGS